MAGRLMRSPLAALALSVLALASPVSEAACEFGDGFEIINPFDPTCGGVMLTLTENDDTGDNVALGYAVPVPVDSLTAVDGFRSYDSLHAQHQLLMADNPDQVQGTVVGQTVAARDIWAYQLGDTDATTADGMAEPAAMVIGGIHAREWQSPEAVTELLETLVEMKADESLGQYLSDNLNVVILPVLNVDGFMQTQAFPETSTADAGQPRDGRMRRKNLRNPNSLGMIDADLATVGDNFWGVDLNRNSAQGFGLNGSSSTSETSLLFRAANPASEPEIQALQFAASLGPEDRLRLYSDTHSFSQIYFTPMTGNARRDAITTELVERMRLVSPRVYRFGPDSAGSGGIGTTADFFAYTFQIPAWTLETEPLSSGADYGGTGASHSGFVLPDSEVARMRDDVANMYLLGIYRQAAPPYAQAIQISETQSGSVVYEAAWVASGPNSRTLDVTVNNALLPGTEYRLWMAFNKPMRFRDDTGAVTNFPGQNVAGSTGSATLEFPGLSGGDIDLAIGDAAAWLDVPGGAPGGYLRYANDAVAVTFSVPQNLSVGAATAGVIAVTNQDLSEFALDADPSSAADWSDGSWAGYEDSMGVAGDAGGTSCSFTPFVAPTSGEAPPANAAPCAAATPPPPPPAPAPPPSGGGGGGGTLDWLLLVLGLLTVRQRRTR